MGTTSAEFFAGELRRARLAAGLTQEQLAQAISYSPSLVAMVEKGKRTPSRDFARRVGECLRTDDLLLRIVDNLLSREITPEWFRPWMELAGAAATLRAYHPSLVNGLLQTPEYARAVVRADGELTDEEVEQRVAARLARQEILTRDRPPMLITVVDEAALRRPVGGPAVMHGQCRHLVELGERPRTLVQVIPVSAGMHSGLNGPFVIATFDGSDDAVHLDGQVGFVVDRPEVVSETWRTWEALRAEALTRQQSADLIREVAKEWT